MKLKHILIALLLVNFTNLFSQDAIDKKIIILNKCCEEYNSLIETKNKLISDMKGYEQSLVEYNYQWKKLCEEYMASTNQTEEDYYYLLRNTDSQKEKELYDKLKSAEYKLKKSSSSFSRDSRPIPNDEENPSRQKHSHSQKKRVCDNKNINPKEVKSDWDYENDILKGKIKN